MSELMQLVGVFLDERRYALPLAGVIGVVNAAAITNLPNASSAVCCAMNVFPVRNVLRRLQETSKQEQSAIVSAKVNSL